MKWTLVCLVLLTAVSCNPSSSGSQKRPGPSESSQAAGSELQAPTARRLFAPSIGGQPVLAGVSYGPFREGQRPGGADPSPDQILEDLQILASRWGMIRIYSSRGPAEVILRTIKEQDIPLRLMLGVWIARDDPQANAAEVREGIRLANAFPAQVLAVSVGNETQVEWSGHRSSLESLVGHIRTVRSSVVQPVSTADDYNFWNKPVSQVVADEVDFLLLHAYAMWNQQTLENAVPWTASTLKSIRAVHPELPIVLGETGWATLLNPDGDEVKYIKAPAGVAEQTAFYADFTAWAASEALPYFYFEAFDEPWKGSDHPAEVEKHWGLYTEKREAKAGPMGALR